MPRSDYNNNPGNLRPPKGVTFDGQIGIDDKGFAIFETPEQGQNALVNDVKTKIGHGLNTPEDFINRYSPAGDNSEEARNNYKIHLADQLGLKSTTDPFPKDAHDKIAQAISSFEGGTWSAPEQSPQAPAQPAVEVASAPASAASGEVPPPEQKKGKDGMPLPMQALATGVAGAGVGSTLGLTKYPLVYGYHKLKGDVEKHQEEKYSRADKQTLGVGDKSEMTGREAQTGYNIKSAQEAARTRDQAQIAKANQLNPDRVLAQAPDLASTPSGIVAPKAAIEDYQRSMQLASEMIKSPNPTWRQRGKEILDKMASLGAVTGKSFPVKAGEFGFGAGSAIPYSIELARHDHPVAAAALPVAAGIAASKFPKTFGGLSTVGALMSAGYAAAHPREFSSQLTPHDINPTAFIGMPEESESAFPEYLPRSAGAGRGFVNPPLASQSED